MEALNIVGYIASEPFTDGFVAHSVQNMTIKNFLNSRKHNLLLSWTEYTGKSSVVFESLLLENFYQGICFYSLDQLWQMKDPNKVLEILKNRNIWIGFAKEGVSFFGQDGHREVLKLFWFKTQIEKNQSNSLWGI